MPRKDRNTVKSTKKSRHRAANRKNTATIRLKKSIRQQKKTEDD